MKLITIIMKRVLVTFLLVGIAFLSFQCKKGSSAPAALKNQAIYSTSADPITSTLQGNVVDENGLPASGVTITINTTIVTTDSIGYFKIPNASLDKNASLVTAVKTGYFKAYRTFCATSGTNQVFIKLIKRTLIGTVSSSAGGAVMLANGAKVLLPAGGVVLASDSVPYSGTINVYTAYINPTDVDIRKLLPGSFMANDINGNRVPLTSYGMLEVELESSTGQQLQIAPGNTATLTTPIPSSMQASAPASISLWYLNDQTGLWQEEGTAIKSGNNYVGTVKHFTYWCTSSSPSNGVMFSATFQTASGTPLENIEISVGAGDYGVAFGYTDSKGQVSGLVAVDSALLIQASDECGNVVFSKNISAQSIDFNIGTVALSVTTPNLYTVSGKLVDCNNVAVSNGSAEILSAGMWRNVSCDNTGNFSTTFLECPISSGNNFTSLQIIGEDDNAHQLGNAFTIPVTSTVITAGNIVACGTSTGYNIYIEGKLVDCNNAAVSVGYAIVNYNGTSQTVACDNTGSFSAEIHYNPDSSNIACQVDGLNGTTHQQGSPSSFMINSILNGNIANMGNIVACGTTFNASVTYTLDGVSDVLPDPLSYLSAFPTNGTDSSTNPYTSFSNITIRSSLTGSYSNSSLQLNFFDNTSTTGAFTVNALSVNGINVVTLIQPFNVTLTNYPSTVGENYVGNFSGQFEDASNVTHTISGSFNEVRTQ